MHWYTVSTKPRQERTVELNLRRMGVETFCAMIKEEKILRRRWQTVIRPLFPGYLFGIFCYEDHQRSISYARGVRRIVVFGSTPAIVQDDLIDAMKSRLEHGYLTVTPDRFNPGDTVRIRGGPLCGLEAVFEKHMTGDRRVALLLRTLAFQARVVVPVEQVANLQCVAMAPSP